MYFHGSYAEMDRLSESMTKQSQVSSSLASHLISTEAKGGNLVFSPLSIHVALSLVAAGSGGPTRDQLLAYFKSDSVEELNTLFAKQATRVLTDGSPLGGPRLSFANSVWVDRSLTFKPDFKGIIENDYKASSNQVDFQTKPDEARQEVNAWADKQTNSLIKDILPPDSVDDRTRLIFANAIYFKGIWSKKFDSSLTKDHEFYLMNGSSAQVPFMTSKKKQLIRACDGFKVLSLPYQRGGDGRRFSMHIFLPDDKDGLPSLVEKFGSGVDFVCEYGGLKRDFVEQHLPYKLVKVGKFLVPKFKMNYGFEASELLKGRALDLLFEGGLTEMVDDDLCVSKVFHKSFIEVNEEGTEAAAATAVVMNICGSLGPVKYETLDFVADHPFLFVVREDATGVLIFIGQVTNPGAGADG